jgi:hypothetical protein
MCALISSKILSETLIIPKRTERDMVKKCIGIQVKCPLFLSHFNEILTSSTDFRKMLKISSRIKNGPVEAELFHADGRTDKKKLTVAVRNSANAINKNEQLQ